MRDCKSLAGSRSSSWTISSAGFLQRCRGEFLCAPQGNCMDGDNVKVEETQSTSKKSGGPRPNRGRPSGPAKPKPDLSDALESKMAATEELARARPFNDIKAAEFDPEFHTAPPEGPAYEPSDPAATGSTLSEANASDKVGSGAPALGINKTIAPMDRVRADSGRPRHDHQPGRADRRQPELAQGRTARPDAARRLHPAGEDHPFRSRAHPRAHRPCPRLRRRTASSKASSR